MYGCPIIPEKTLVLKMEQRVQPGPLHPEFNVVKDRRRSFEENGINNGNTALQAEAGFYCTGKLNLLNFIGAITFVYIVIPMTFSNIFNSINKDTSIRTLKSM
jgi:hypothetical protein